MSDDAEETIKSDAVKMEDTVDKERAAKRQRFVFALVVLVSDIFNFSLSNLFIDFN